MTAEERRIHDTERIPSRRPVAIFSGQDGRVVRGSTINLSPTGMAVELDEPITLGDHLVFRMDIGEEFAPIVQGGKVAWTRPNENPVTAGIRFIEIPSRTPPRTLDPAPAPQPDLFRSGEELRVRVGGMTEALKAETVEHDAAGTLRFRCPLAFLKIRSPVIAHRPADDGPVFEGRIVEVQTRVSPEDGIPDLMVTATVRDPACDGACIGGPVEAAGLPGESTVEPSPAPEPPAPRMAAAEPVRGACGAPFEPTRPSESARCAAATVAGHGRRIIARAAAAARSAAHATARIAGPALRQAGAVTVAALVAFWRGLSSLAGRWIRRRRRDHLPRTLSDVREVQSRSGSTRRMVHRVALAMSALGLALAVWGLLGRGSASARDAESARGPAPSPPASPLAESEPSAGPLPSGIPTAWPSSPDPPSPSIDRVPAYASVVARPPDGEPPQSEPEIGVPPPPRGQTQPRPTVANHPRTPQAPLEAPAEPAPPAQGRTVGRTLMIPLDGPPTDIRAYALREPPGIVVDVRGTTVARGATQITVGSREVRLVKAIPRGNGSTRVIVYLRAAGTPHFRTESSGRELRITLLGTR